MKISGGDFFCGAGGFTEGALQAVNAAGGTVKHWLAINHWPRAIHTHTMNHPEARHMCVRLDQVRPEDAVKSKRMDILLASPECTHHSVARGGKPMNDQSRAGAWSIIDWVNRIHIEALLIENVREFRNWGPLNRQGRPIKSKAGQTYQAFLNALRAAGYTVEDRLINCADYGDPTTRTRLFIQAQRTRPVCWPEPSHIGKWRAAREIIDWQLKGASIFSRKKPLSEKTLARIEAGLQKFGLGPFLAKTCNANSGKKNAANWNVHDVTRPLGAVTSASERALVEPFIVPVGYGERKGQKPRVRSVKEPLSTVVNSAKHGLCEPFIVGVEHTGSNGKEVRSVKQPLSTVSAHARKALAEPFLVKLRGTGKANSVKKPVPTVTAGGTHLGLAEPFLVQTAHGNDDRTGNERRAKSVDKPLATVRGANEWGVAEPFLVQTAHAGKRRPRSVKEPMPTVAGHRGDFAVVEPRIVNGKDVTEYECSSCGFETFNDLKKCHCGGQMVKSKAFILGQQSCAAARSVKKPIPTVATDGAIALVQPFLTEYYGNGGAKSVDKPMPTATTKCRFGLAMPMVKIGRKKYLVDILFRMLQPHELAAAQGFPKEYHFTGNKSEVVKQIGNAVPVNTARALVRAALFGPSGLVAKRRKK